MAFKVKAPPVMSAINVIPMADIMLVLLIIFMVVTPMLQKGQGVDLAPTDHPSEMKEADQDDAVLLAIGKDGSIYLGTEKIPMDQVKTRVLDMISNRMDKMVFVKSDMRAKYGTVVAVVDEVRAAGVDKLGLLTEKSADSAKQPAKTGGS